MKKIWRQHVCGITAAAVVLAGTAASLPADLSAVFPAAAVSIAANPITTSAVQNFTTDGLSSDYFDISGNLSTGKGSVTYNGMTLTQCLKMETATSIGFTTGSAVTLTLVIKDGTTVKVDDTAYDIPTSNIVTVQLQAGSHTVTKGSGSSNLFYMSVTGGNGTEPIVTTVSTTDSGTVTTATTGSGQMTQGDFKLISSGGWNEMLYATVSGISDADVTGVSYSGAASGSLSGDDLAYLVRDVSGGVRVDIPGVPAGTYTLTLETSKGNAAISGITVSAQDRSGYAHFNYTSGVGAYTDSGTLKANAKVIYVTDSNKNSVSVTSKDGTKVTGIGNILNSAGASSTSGSKTNSNNGIIKKLAEDGTPLVVRIIGDVKAPDGLTAYNSTDYGGSVGDNGYMARMKSGKDVTIEGIGTDAQINGWGIHFMAESAAASLGKSFEVRNLKFRNVPEDCIGMEGVQSGDALTASVERCWIHNNEFYKPTISNPAESDKSGGDGACDFKRGMYFTNSYNYYEGYHKTNLIGASDSNLQFHITFHHNYWKDCESRGPLARQANIHMYNNVFQGQTSYCQNPRADAYIFSEYNLFDSCKNPQQIKQGAIKSYNDTLTNCKGDMDATVVTNKSQKVSSNNRYGDFDTNSALSYIPSNSYNLLTDTSKLLSYFGTWGGTLDDQSKSGSFAASAGTTASTTTTTTTTTVTTTTTTFTTTTATESTAVTTETTLSQPTETTTVSTQQGGIKGDLDCNGQVLLEDAVMLAKAAGGFDVGLSAQGRLNAELDGKDGITGGDLTVLLQYLSGIISKL